MSELTPDSSIYTDPIYTQTQAMLAARRKAKETSTTPTNSGGFGSHTGGVGSGGSPASNGSQSGSPMFDLFGSSAGYVAQRQPAGENYMTSYYIEKYNALRVDLYFNDFSGGIDAQIRQIGDGVFTNALAYASALAGSRTLVLPPLLTADATSTNEIGELDALSSCFLLDGSTPRWLVAGGDVQNKCLFALGATLTAQTYNPGANIISLTTVKIATAVERVIVGREGSAAQVLTTFAGSPTVSGTMHANTSSLWGVIRTTLNSTTPGAENLLLYCNGGLYILSSTAAIGDAPTAVLTNWPDGGYAIGICTASTDGVAAAYWAHPVNDLTVSALAEAGTPMKLVRTNLEGLDPKEVDVGMPWFTHAMKWGTRGITIENGKSFHWLNTAGDIINLGWNRERYWKNLGAEGFGTIQSIAVLGDRLLACTTAITADANDIAEPTIWEEYIPEENVWKFFCVGNPSAGLLPNISRFTGRTPFYEPFDTAVDAGYFWWYAKIGGGSIAPTYQWQQVPVLPTGVDPQWQQTEAVRLFFKFATSGYAITPVYIPMPGVPGIVSDIKLNGSFRGEDSQVTIERAVDGVASLSFATQNVATFKEDSDWKRNWWINRDPDPEASMSDKFQFKISLAQGTSGTYVTKTSPNALPFRVGIYLFLDGKYKHPKVMEPQRYWGDEE